MDKIAQIDEREEEVAAEGRFITLSAGTLQARLRHRTQRIIILLKAQIVIVFSQYKHSDFVSVLWSCA